jgi:hypothetical protein
MDVQKDIIQKNIKGKVDELPNGKLSVTLACEKCGEPIDKVTARYGYDCKNDCNKKEWQKRKSSPKSEIDKMVREFLKTGKIK